MADQEFYFKGYPNDLVPDAQIGEDAIVVPGYQRPHSDTWETKRIAEGFSRHSFGTIVLGRIPEREGGGVEIIDGWRRCRLARACGITKVPARILTEMSYAERARVFTEIDHRKSLTTWDTYKANREMGDQTVLDIDRILRSHSRVILGKDVPLYAAGTGNGFAAIKAIDSLLRSYHAKPTARAFDAALGYLTWWTTEGQQIHGGLLLGMTMMISDQSSKKTGGTTSAKTTRTTAQKTTFDLKNFDSVRFHDALKRTTYDLATAVVSVIRGQQQGKGGGHDEGFWKQMFTILYTEGKLPTRVLPGADFAVALTGGVNHTIEEPIVESKAA